MTPRFLTLVLLASAAAAGCVETGKSPSPPAAPAKAAAAPLAPPAVAAAPAEPAIIAFPGEEVPRAAIAAETRLRTLRSLAGRTAESDEIEATSRTVLASVEALKEWMATRDPRQQTSRALRSIGHEWRLDAEMLNGWMDATGRRIDALGTARAELARLGKTWSMTDSALAEAGAADALRDRAATVLHAIDDLEPKLRGEMERVLLLQSRISAGSLDAEEAQETIAATLREESRSLLRIDAPPLWRAFHADTAGEPLGTQLGESVREGLRALRQYADRAGRSLTAQLLLFVALTVLFVRLRRQSAVWPKDERGVVACARLVKRPLLGALLVTLLGGAWIHPRAPLAFYEISSLLLAVPVVVILRGVVSPRVRGPLYSLAAIFVIERIWESTPGGSSLERTLMLGLTVVSAATLAWTIRPPAVVPALVAGRWWRAIDVAGRVALLALAIALLANVFGNLSLARLLTATVVRAGYFAVVLYSAALILRGTATLLVRASAHTSRAVLRHADALVYRAKLGIDAVAVFFFLLLTISATGQWSLIVRNVEGLLVKHWGIGDFQFSFESAFIFLAAIYASIVVSGILRTVLEDDVYPRVRLPRGVPATLTMLIRYSVICTGFLLAAAIAGIPLDRLAIVLGAFSVGIGFGLQTVVNNFVSGLILMFERPIQIGDAIEVGGLVGRVRSIGVRASRIETFDGAEVVVPNGTLVSNQLINWTLTNRDRRIEIQVGVAYGTDPERVLALLRGAVSGQPGVLPAPEPFALFRGFGSSSLDFSLFFWTADFDNWTRAKSDMTVRVHHALGESGIEIPFPQHDVHMKP